MRLSAIIADYLETCKARRLSEHTIQDYQNTFTKFSRYLGDDLLIGDITIRQIVGFLAACDVRPKTICNYHTALSALWRYAVDNSIAAENIIRKIKPPRPDTREIAPLDRSDITSMLAAAKDGDNPLRDAAIILTLLDTGLRASELCNLRIQDLNGHSFLVTGKGRKERRLIVSEITYQAIQTYIESERPKVKKRSDVVFCVRSGERLTRHALRLLLTRLEIRAGLGHVHPHKFRHTFAIQYLRNGGNIFALQRLLGHTSLDMVRRYLSLAQSDIDADHYRASPVKCWSLHGSGP